MTIGGGAEALPPFNFKAIEAEREVTHHYMTQMGRWVERLKKG